MTDHNARPPRSLPSIVWVLIIIGGMIALVGAIIGSFFAFSTVEGLGSIVLLAAGWITLRAGASEAPKPKGQSDSAFVALGLVFFAMMGLALDQPGNYVYNRPLEWLFCPAGTQLTREADIRHPRAGVTQISQDFTCVDARGRTQTTIPTEWVIVVRVVEYILIGYLLMWASRVYTRLRKPKTVPA